MGKIILLRKLEKTLEKIHADGKSIVLVGGCFDVLHVGHIKFLKEAKTYGDFLFVLLESDEKVNNLKGPSRPYFSQKDRAEVLSSIACVDYIILLNPMAKDEDYNKLIQQIRPQVIAVTENDPIISKKKNQVQLVGGKLEIIPYLATFSTSQLAKLIGIE